MCGCRPCPSSSSYCASSNCLLYKKKKKKTVEKTATTTTTTTTTKNRFALSVLILLWLERTDVVASVTRSPSGYSQTRPQAAAPRNIAHWSAFLSSSSSSLSSSSLPCAWRRRPPLSVSRKRPLVVGVPITVSQPQQKRRASATAAGRRQCPLPKRGHHGPPALALSSLQQQEEKLPEKKESHNSSLWNRMVGSLFRSRPTRQKQQQQRRLEHDNKTHHHQNETTTTGIITVQHQGFDLPALPPHEYSTVSFQEQQQQQQQAPVINQTNNNTVTLDLNDLDRLLQERGYLRANDGSATARRGSRKAASSSLSRDEDQRSKTTVSTTKTTTTTPQGDRRVAFPQRTVVSVQHLQRGTMVAGSVLGSLVGITLSPNLWFLGAVGGASYGHSLVPVSSLAAATTTTTSKPSGRGTASSIMTAEAFLSPQQVDNDSPTRRKTNIVAQVVYQAGWKSALWFWLVRDSLQALWFMYRTGQLSYAYYKQYESLDRRYGIQRRIDAWNARFVQGKLAFDQWERNNEVGRRLLATLRTVWLVEANSLKKASPRKRRRRSKYRLVQAAMDIQDWFSGILRTLLSVIVGGPAQQEVGIVLRGLQSRILSLGTTTAAAATSWGAMAGALATILVVGTIWHVAPALLVLGAIVWGLAWPTWMTQCQDAWQQVVEDLQDEGRAFVELKANGAGAGTSSRSSSMATRNKSNIKKKKKKKKTTTTRSRTTKTTTRDNNKTHDCWLVRQFQEQDESPSKPSFVFWKQEPKKKKQTWFPWSLQQEQEGSAAAKRKRKQQREAKRR